MDGNNGATTQANNTTTNLNPESPGKFLAEARISENISIEEISSLMKVTSRIIKYIEKDEYENNRIDIFMHNHIKRYCKIVNVDTNKIFAKLECMGFSDYGTPQPKTINHKQVATLSRSQAITHYVMAIMLMVSSIAILVIHNNNPKTIPNYEINIHKATNIPATIARK